MDSKESSGILESAMRVVRVVNSDGVPILISGDAPKPQIGRGEVLIEVAAAGVMLAETSWYPTTHTKTGQSRVGAVPGHEFSGVVVGVGGDVGHLGGGAAGLGMKA